MLTRRKHKLLLRRQSSVKRVHAKRRILIQLVQILDAEYNVHPPVLLCVDRG